MVAAGSARRGRMFGGALPYILLSPLVVFIGALSFVPTVDTTVKGCFRVSPLNPPTQFTGLGNFRALFASPAVNGAWVNTAVYVVIGVVLSVVLGTVIALALRQRFRFRGIVLALVILPWALPAVVESVDLELDLLPDLRRHEQRSAPRPTSSAGTTCGSASTGG